MAFNAGPAQNANKDFEVSSAPTDGISCLAFSPTSNLLLGTSWDNQVRVWDVQGNGTTTPKAATSHEGPVLSAAWSGDGQKIFSAGCDNKAKCWTLQTNQSIVFGQHQAPIKHIAWVEEMQMAVTGSWDKTVKFWDVRQPNPAHTVNLTERVHCMDVKHPACVIATADKFISVYDFRNPGKEYKRIASPLKHQSRSIACFLPDKSGFALGSIEGRVAIQYIEDKDAAKNFAFKCHREQVREGGREVTEIYSVNVIAFHQIHGTFATAGSDGTFNFWDKDSKQRLKQFQKCGAPISAGAFNANGQIFAYSVSYDWSKGHEHYNASQKNNIYLHSVQESEIKSRGGKR